MQLEKWETDFETLEDIGGISDKLMINLAYHASLWEVSPDLDNHVKDDLVLGAALTILHGCLMIVLNKLAKEHGLGVSKSAC